jgi:hypothetical protein
MIYIIETITVRFAQRKLAMAPYDHPKPAITLDRCSQARRAISLVTPI